MTEPTADGLDRRAPVPLDYRPVATSELSTCVDIWRTSINDYVTRLGQAPIEPDSGRLLRLYEHLQATDPSRFAVASTVEGPTPGAARIVAFASAILREHLWFLSMCFVLPEFQGAGVGRGLLASIAPPADESIARATATDSAQPVSNALYASMGLVPRVPLLDLIGHPLRPEAFGSLPSGVRPVPFDSIAAAPGGEGHAVLSQAVDRLDREVLGVSHPVDHRYLRLEDRRGWLYHGPDGAPVGYGYGSEAGRLGPVAVRDGALLAPVLGHLTSAIQPRGAFAVWLPGTADQAVMATLAAGFRLAGFPVLLCWDRPFADLTRYLPISPGLL